MKEFRRYTIEVAEGEQREMAIAILSDMGVDAFEEREDKLVASGINQDVDKKNIDQWLSELGMTFSDEVLPDQNWNAEWESSFEPVLVDDFVAVRAAFHAQPQGVEHEIIITPKMSFGTGHHATTWLVMQAMRRLDFKNKSVLDFGTGTGVLAILAEKLGAARVLAIDNDEWSIANTHENLQANECKNVEVILQGRPPAGALFDIVLANINKHILLAQMPQIAAVTVAAGVVILSGLLAADEFDIVTGAVYESLGFLEKSERQGWICIKLKKHKS